MRYIQSSSTRDLVTLTDEAEYIRQYVHLQSLRLGKKTRVNLHTDVTGSPALIPPMLLITFVENCFKHGVSSDVESEIVISLTQSDGELRLHTSNRIFPAERIGEHTGIANCRKRLELLYPARHSLSIVSESDLFIVNLRIRL